MSDLSNVSIGDHRLTWQELAERNGKQLREAQSLLRVLHDLDRCEHGRHEGDICSECGGPSLGNPFTKPDDHRVRVRLDAVPRQIGFNIGGRPIVVPTDHRSGDVEAWDG